MLSPETIAYAAEHGLIQDISSNSLQHVDLSCLPCRPIDLEDVRPRLLSPAWQRPQDFDRLTLTNEEATEIAALVRSVSKPFEEAREWDIPPPIEIHLPEPKRCEEVITSYAVFRRQCRIEQQAWYDKLLPPLQLEACAEVALERDTFKVNDYAMPTIDELLNIKLTLTSDQADGIRAIYKALGKRSLEDDELWSLDLPPEIDDKSSPMLYPRQEGSHLRHDASPSPLSTPPPRAFQSALATDRMPASCASLALHLEPLALPHPFVQQSSLPWVELGSVPNSQEAGPPVATACEQVWKSDPRIPPAFDSNSSISGARSSPRPASSILARTSHSTAESHTSHPLGSDTLHSPNTLPALVPRYRSSVDAKMQAYYALRRGQVESQISPPLHFIHRGPFQSHTLSQIEPQSGSRPVAEPFRCVASFRLLQHPVLPALHDHFNLLEWPSSLPSDGDFFSLKDFPDLVIDGTTCATFLLLTNLRGADLIQTARDFEERWGFETQLIILIGSKSTADMPPMRKELSVLEENQLELASIKIEMAADARAAAICVARFASKRRDLLQSSEGWTPWSDPSREWLKEDLSEDAYTLEVNAGLHFFAAQAVVATVSLQGLLDMSPDDRLLYLMNIISPSQANLLNERIELNENAMAVENDI